MSKSNNKGISLIDVIIAVAVMSILISPIIAQIITTVDTSSRAKERQYVIDDADKVMDYFRSNSLKELSETGDKGEAIIINSVSESEVKFKAYDFGASGSEDYDSPVVKEKDSLNNDLKYTVIDYVLGSKDETGTISSYEILGREKNRYSRTVSLDDLSNVLLEQGLVINYNAGKGNTAEDNERKDKLTDLGFEFTNEGAAVMYDSNGHVNAVACLESGSTSYTNPNKSTPIITDIDSEKMAIIEGNASSIDHQFQSDFISNLLTIVSKKKTYLESQPASGSTKETLYEYYQNTDNLNSVFDGARLNNDFYRLIKLTVIGEDVVDDKPSHYRVKCEVYYKAQYTFLEETFGSDEDNKKFRYTVFDQTYNTSEPPDVLFVYEPFIKQMDATYTAYAPEDFISIKSDKYTSGAVSGYDPSKIYLIKADSTWADEVVGRYTPSDTDELDSINKDQDPQHYSNYFYYVNNTTNVPVDINVNQITDDSDSDALPLQIITNISWRPNDNTATGLADDNPVLNKAVNGNYQFSMDVSSASYKPNVGLSSSEHLAEYPQSGVGSNIKQIEYPASTKLESRYAIDCPTSDTVEYGRLYSITVRYHNEDRATEANVYTYFTGAKGAD